MKKVFSYSLFEPKVLPQHRFWDTKKNDKNRYWYNIPTISIVNEALFPEYENIFYVSKNIWNNPVSEVFDICSNIECRTIDKDYDLTEPAIWRMMPLWNLDVDILCTRDLDSLPSIEEYYFLKEFEKSDCLVGTLRSHENHYGLSCRMLAGLSSFKANKIPFEIKGPNYYFYEVNKLDRYGSDQELLIRTFTTNEEFTKNYFLDCKIHKQKNSQDFACNNFSIKEYEIENQKQEIFDLIKNKTNSEWLGQPCDSRGELLKEILKMNSEIKEKIINNKFLKEFYKV